MSEAKPTSKASAPSLREVIQKTCGFVQLTCAQEDLARTGERGVVRIGAMAPVMEAIGPYITQFPKAEVGR